jgi:hypothetical protein
MLLRDVRLHFATGPQAELPARILLQPFRDYDQWNLQRNGHA